jgi:hypothetical protein
MGQCVPVPYPVELLAAHTYGRVMDTQLDAL